jgi:hypothetical protein
MKEAGLLGQATRQMLVEHPIKPTQSALHNTRLGDSFQATVFRTREQSLAKEHLRE